MVSANESSSAAVPPSGSWIAVWRVPAAFLLAPLIPCMLYATEMSAISNQWNGFRFTLLAMIVVSESLTLLVAVPLYLFLRRRRPIGLAACILSGVGVTIMLNLATTVLSLNPGYSAGDGGGSTIEHGHLTGHGIVSLILGTAVQSLLGAAIGLVFWMIAVGRKRIRSDDIEC